jgi:two-component system chemotaxis response regulator CheY
LNDTVSAPGELAAEKGPSSPPHRILVVDDDLNVCRFNADILARYGYQVVTAPDGQAAWEELQAKSFDLLITDNDMPRLSGLQLVEKLRSEHFELPVIFASGSLDADELAQNPSLHIAATLSKPYVPRQLLEIVKKVLRKDGPTGA